MQKQRYEYKEQAKQLMLGKYDIVIPVLLIFVAVQALLGWLQDLFAVKYDINFETFEIITISQGVPILNSLFQIISFILGAFITYAIIRLFIGIVRGETLKIEEVLLCGVKTERPTKSIVLSLFTSLFVALWTLLFIIPGIVKAYAYSMGFYLLNQDPSLSGREALDKSKEITQGYKKDLLLLDLSYLGWYFLGIFTLGILWLWIIPKHQTAKILYFDEIYATRVAPQIVQIDEESIIY